MLAVAARCIRLLPLRAPRALPPPSLALRARAPARAFAPRSLAVAAMDSSDVEAKAAKLPAVTAAGEEIAPAAKAEKKPRARKAPAKKEKAGDDAEGGDAEAAGEKAAKKPKAEVEKAVLPRSDTPRKPPPAGCALLMRPASRRVRALGSQGYARCPPNNWASTGRRSKRSAGTWRACAPC